jgi:microcystin-dependent protein
VTLTQANMPGALGGSSLPVDDQQPSLGVRYVMNVYGTFPPFSGSGQADLGNMGMVFAWAGGDVPESSAYIECRGQLLAIDQFQALFQIIGTTYGGDGSTTFALPDLQGRTIVGAGNGLVVGERDGGQDVTLTTANLPVEMGGGGQGFYNIEPRLAMNYIIAVNGIAPNAGVDTVTVSTAMTGEIVAFAGWYAPAGWMACEGQLLQIASYTTLFSQIGTTYGGDGINTFALPDLRGRSLTGAGDGIAVGEVLGSDSQVLTLDDIPDLNYLGTAAADVLFGGNGHDTIGGNEGNDRIRSWGGDDALSGGIGNDKLFGDKGNDTLNGDDGVDKLFGGAGNDILNGGNNADRLVGGGGIDTLTGGLGRDTFVFTVAGSGNDRITDWRPVQGDKIEIDASAFGGGLVAGGLTANQLVMGTTANQAFGQFLFNTSTGQLRWDADGTGAGAAVNVAILSNGGNPVTSLLISDFDIVA